MGSKSPSATRCCAYDPGKAPKITSPSLIQPLLDAVGAWGQALLSPIFSGFTQQISNNSQACANGSVPSTKDPKDPNCSCIAAATNSTDKAGQLCNNIQNNQEKETCKSCMVSGGDKINCIWTAIGKVDTDLGKFIGEKLLTWGIGVAGGVAMLCIMYAAFMMQTSGGNAEQVKKAQQMLTSCITGLMLILFSVFILKLIGIDILRIPGFG